MATAYNTSVTATNGYTFTQDSASTTWNIVHLLNTTAPVVDCWVDVGGVMTKIIPDVVAVVDASTLQITFTTPYAGKAYVV